MSAFVSWLQSHLRKTEDGTVYAAPTDGEFVTIFNAIGFTSYVAVVSRFHVD
jgi:hypothetical protein